MGHLIPAGTGLPAYRRLKIDTLVLMWKNYHQKKRQSMLKALVSNSEVDLNEVPGCQLISETPAQEQTEESDRRSELIAIQLNL